MARRGPGRTPTPTTARTRTSSSRSWSTGDALGPAIRRPTTTTPMVTSRRSPTRSATSPRSTWSTRWAGPWSRPIPTAWRPTTSTTSRAGSRASTVNPGSGEAITTFVYDPAGQLKATTHPGGTVLAYAYHGAHRLTEIANGLGEKIVDNQRQRRCRPGAGAIVDGRARQDADAHVRRARADAEVDRRARSGRRLRLQQERQGQRPYTDPLGNPTRNADDALNRVITVTDALSHLAAYGFNATDQVASVTDKNGNATSFFVRNGFGEAVRRTSPDTASPTTSTIFAGNPTSMTDARGVVTDGRYDNLNRRTSKTFPGHTSENAAYTYARLDGVLAPARPADRHRRRERARLRSSTTRAATSRRRRAPSASASTRRSTPTTPPVGRSSSNTRRAARSTTCATPTAG